MEHCGIYAFFMHILVFYAICHRKIIFSSSFQFCYSFPIFFKRHLPPPVNEVDALKIDGEKALQRGKYCSTWRSVISLVDELNATSRAGVEYNFYTGVVAGNNFFPRRLLSCRRLLQTRRQIHMKWLGRPDRQRTPVTVWNELEARLETVHLSLAVDDEINVKVLA